MLLLTPWEITQMLNFLLDNVYVQVRDLGFKQCIGIPIGTNCAPLLVVAEHILCQSHDIDWKNAQILDKEKKKRSRQVKEALWIDQKKTTLNKDKGMDLDKIWLTVL